MTALGVSLTMQARVAVWPVDTATMGCGTCTTGAHASTSKLNLSHSLPFMFGGEAQAVGLLKRLLYMSHCQNSCSRQSHCHGLPCRVRLFRLTMGTKVRFSSRRKRL